MHGNGSQICLRVPSAIPYLDLLQNVAEESAQILGFPEDGRMDVGLAVREGAINAMKHAHRFDPALPVTITLGVDGQRLRISIFDEGPGFEPTDLPDPTSPENIWRTSGRGLLLIRSLVDMLDYVRRPGGGMELILEKSIPLPATQPARETEL